MNKKSLLVIIFIFLLVGCGQDADQQIVQEIDKEKTVETTTNSDKNLEVETKEKPASSNNKSLSELKIHYIDAGQADATLFQYTDQGESYTILYDTGDWNKNDVVNYLAAQNVSSIDLVIVSHPHADHIGQLTQIMETYEVGEVWLSGNTASSNTFQHAIESVLESDADFYEPRTGDSFDIGSMGIEVLHPSTLTEELNEDSISLLFTYGEIKLLFTGDASKNEEIIMLQNATDIQADILQLGHHGSKTSSDPAFIKAVNPSIAIYSAGANNSYGHPHAEVISFLQNTGITVYGSDVHGTIIVTTDGNKYDIQTKEDGTISPKSTGSANSSSNKIEEKPSSEEKESTSSSCIDINQATLEEVQQIIHIGPARAENLIDQRPYDSLSDLNSIKGIGPARIADIKSQNLACIGG